MAAPGQIRAARGPGARGARRGLSRARHEPGATRRTQAARRQRAWIERTCQAAAGSSNAGAPQPSQRPDGSRCRCRGRAHLHRDGLRASRNARGALPRASRRLRVSLSRLARAFTRSGARAGGRPRGRHRSSGRETREHPGRRGRPPARGGLRPRQGEGRRPRHDRFFTGHVHVARDADQNRRRRRHNPAYMAPEQFVGAGDAASDQFGLCVTLWEAGLRPTSIRWRRSGGAARCGALRSGGARRSAPQRSAVVATSAGPGAALRTERAVVVGGGARTRARTSRQRDHAEVLAHADPRPWVRSRSLRRA